MESNRQKKIAAVLQSDLVDVLQGAATKGGMHGIIISVTKVKVTVDLSIAKVYLSIFPNNKAKELIKGIQSNSALIKHEIAQRTRHQLRRMPELEFFIDGIDWVTKKALIDEYGEGDIEMGMALCNQYTLLDETVLKYIGETSDTENIHTPFNFENSLEFAEDAIPWENWSRFTDLVKKGLMNGPEGSRDYLRCLVLREFPGLLESIEWESINFYNVKIKLDEPLMYNKEMCGDLENHTNTFVEFSKALDSLNREKAQLMYAPHDDLYRPDKEDI